jgi:hypothetical protein
MGKLFRRNNAICRRSEASAAESAALEWRMKNVCSPWIGEKLQLMMITISAVDAFAHTKSGRARVIGNLNFVSFFDFALYRRCAGSGPGPNEANKSTICFGWIYLSPRALEMDFDVREGIM